MRWRPPWVSREMLETERRATTSWCGAAVNAEARAERAEKRIAALTDELLALRKDGWAPPIPPGPQAPKLPDVVERAIARAGGGNLMVQRLSRAAAEKLYAEGLDPQQIATRIVQGQRTLGDD